MEGYFIQQIPAQGPKLFSLDGEVAAAAEYLRGLDVVAGDGLGVVGFSLGAYYALGLPVDKHEVVRAVVVFYGARIEFLRSTLAG